LSAHEKFFVGESIEPDGAFDPVTISHGEPSLPTSFRWREETLTIESIVRTWRSTKTDRGDVYLAKHWYEMALTDGRRAVIYFDRQGKRGVARWWLYTLEGT
jgi:hypothetical protein